jgi:hypothetical protein
LGLAEADERDIQDAKALFRRVLLGALNENV